MPAAFAGAAGRIGGSGGIADRTWKVGKMLASIPPKPLAGNSTLVKSSGKPGMRGNPFLIKPTSRFAEVPNYPKGD